MAKRLANSDNDVYFYLLEKKEHRSATVHYNLRLIKAERSELRYVVRRTERACAPFHATDALLFSP